MILLLIFVSALLQDVAFTCKTALVAHDRLWPAMGADAAGMLLSLAYVSLTAANLVRTGLSLQTALSFALVLVGGAMGTGCGMLLARTLERRYGKAVPHHMRAVGALHARRIVLR